MLTTSHIVVTVDRLVDPTNEILHHSALKHIFLSSVANFFSFFVSFAHEHAPDIQISKSANFFGFRPQYCCYSDSLEHKLEDARL